MLSSKLLKEITETTNKEADNMSHEFVMPGKVITGKGALQDAKKEFQTAGKKALIDRIWQGHGTRRKCKKDHRDLR